MTEKRVELIKEIEKARGSKLLCYVTGDRPGLQTLIADDAVRVLYSNLETLGDCDQLDLFLYSRGGQTLAPYRMVNLIREYCKNFSVLVPYRAHSAATLLCLGANEIVMGRLGELSPVDPSAANPFNPANPANPMNPLPISVEDVTSYFMLAKEKASLTQQDSMAEVFKALTEKVHPLALGNIQRSHSLIRLLAHNLLALHMDPKQKTKIDTIVETLTEKLYTHDYAITRHEAKNTLGLKVVYPEPELDQAMWKLYEQYEKDLAIREPLNPLTILGDNSSSADFSYVGAVIESVQRSDTFHIEGTITRTPNPAVPFFVALKAQEWRNTR